MPDVGDQISTYRLLAPIGKGGMGMVYRAHDERLDRDVALKLLTPQVSDDDAFRARFQREAQVAGALRNPNIVPVFDAGEWQGQLYLAMMLVEGPNLATVIKRDAPLPLRRVMGIVGQIAGALDAAHSQGIVHRDVKPGNILLVEGRAPDGGDYAYLADFGLTRPVTAMTQMTQMGVFLGTLDYIAPEQLQQQTIDGRADQYALACTVFEMLTAAPPYQRDSDIALISAHLYDPPPALETMRPDLPRAMGAVVARAMAKDPESRFPTAGSFFQALNQAAVEPHTSVPTVAGRVAALPPQGVVPGSPQIVQRSDGGHTHRPMAIAFAVVALAVVLGAAAVWNLNLLGTRTGSPASASLPSRSSPDAAVAVATGSPSGVPPTQNAPSDVPIASGTGQQSAFKPPPQLPPGVWNVSFTLDHVEGNPVFKPDVDERTYAAANTTCQSQLSCVLTFHQRLPDGRDLGTIQYFWDGQQFIADEDTHQKGNKCNGANGAEVPNAYNAHQRVQLAPVDPGSGQVTQLIGNKVLSGEPNGNGTLSGCEPYAVYFDASMTLSTGVPVPSVAPAPVPTPPPSDGVRVLNFEQLPEVFPANTPFILAAEWCSYTPNHNDEALASNLQMFADQSQLSPDVQSYQNEDPLGGTVPCLVAKTYFASFSSGLGAGVHEFDVNWQPSWRSAVSESHSITFQ